MRVVKLGGSHQVNSVESSLSHALEPVLQRSGVAARLHALAFAREACSARSVFIHESKS
jgi:hypothetical protein